MANKGREKKSKRRRKKKERKKLRLSGEERADESSGEKRKERCQRGGAKLGETSTKYRLAPYQYRSQSPR
jgi:hypothetical protein